MHISILYIWGRLTTTVGILLSVYSTHNQPFRELRLRNQMALLEQITKYNIKPTFGHDSPDWVETIAHQCLDNDPMKRPSAKDVICMFEAPELDSSFIVQQELIGRGASAEVYKGTYRQFDVAIKVFYPSSGRAKFFADECQISHM